MPTADRQKATVRVRIGFEQLDPRILPDMGVKVAFLDDGSPSGRRGRPRPRLLVPESRGAHRRRAQSIVFVVRDDRVERRAVHGRRRPDGEQIEVVSGLNAGERVVRRRRRPTLDGRRRVSTAIRAMSWRVK